MSEATEQSRKTHASQRLYGLLAEYVDAEPLLEAARTVRDAGYKKTDAFTPFPMEELPEAMGWKKSWMALAFLIGGVCGGVIAYFGMWYANVISYPLDIAGRAPHSWPAFIPVTFELTVLGSALTGFFTLLIRCKLPRPHHPLFDVEGFERSGKDRFFLLIESTDPAFDEHATSELLESTQPIRLVAVERSRP